MADEVRDAFNVCFSGKNKSAVISNLMMQAVVEEKNKRKRVQAIDSLDDDKSRCCDDTPGGTFLMW